MLSDYDNEPHLLAQLTSIEGHSSAAVPLPDYTVFVDQVTYGWSLLTFHNSTHMTEQFIDATNGTVVDSATLYREHSECSW
jgi:hypothetical protein